MLFRLSYFVVFVLLGSTFARADPPGYEDRHLARVVRELELVPIPYKPYDMNDKFLLGQALFFDPLLSGNRDVACATCHLVEAGLSDGLASSIGTLGKGVGDKRSPLAGRKLQPRNALDLWNRDHNRVRSMFWDGRVQVVASGRFQTALGLRLPRGFDNLMAVQAIFPLTRPDEMLGLPGDVAPADLPPAHANRPNEIANLAAIERDPSERMLTVFDLVLERLLGRTAPELETWQEAYRKLFRRAFPHKSLAEIDVSDLGNAIAHFEEIAFASRSLAPWDLYLQGDFSALSTQGKKGALIFFGKGRCGICHSGPLFSDFEFHSVGVRDFGPGFEGGTDLGRFYVTRNDADKFLFRTPPLRNVTLTAPYFHNGSASTLREVIIQHQLPLSRAERYEKTGEFFLNAEQVRAVSPLLWKSTQLSAEDADALVAFLGSLEDPPVSLEINIVPQSVPSGIDFASR